MTNQSPIPKRVERCQTTLAHYAEDRPFTNLVDLMADAMHWCDANGEDFHYAFCLAGKHFIAELNDEPNQERI